MKKFILFVWFTSLFSDVGISQSEYADSIMQAALKRMEKIPTYVCDISVLLDVEWINIKERTGKVYFYPPDSINYEIKGFAFLPKTGYNSQVSAITENKYTPLHLGKELVSDVSCDIIKIIPSDIESEVVLGQFWIDKNLNIRKMTIITKEEGSYSILLEYGTEKYAVPKKVTVTFDIKSQELPASMTGDVERQEEDRPKGEKTKGSIVIYYSNYVFK